MQVVHQPAFLHRQNLVEGPGDVEADGWHILQALTLILGQCLNLLLGQIALVGTAEVEFIAIGQCLHTAQNRVELRQLHLADTRQLILYLLLLELELFLIGQVLPFTAATNAEMFTERCRAYLTIFYEAHHFALGKGVLLAPYLYVADIAWYTEWHKHHQFLPVEQAFPFSGNCFYRHALKER